MAKYYGLYVKEDGRWSFVFGDNSKQLVNYEFDDYRDHGFKRNQLKLVVWEKMPNQHDIMASMPRDHI